MSTDANTKTVHMYMSCRKYENCEVSGLMHITTSMFVYSYALGLHLVLLVA